MSEIRLTVLDHFAAIEDPRREHGRLHRIGDIVAITLCAVISGADSFEQIGIFARAREAWLTGLLGLENGVPSHDTIRRVFAAVKPAAFEECFFAWMNACCDAAGLNRITSTARPCAAPPAGARTARARCRPCTSSAPRPGRTA